MTMQTSILFRYNLNKDSLSLTAIFYFFSDLFAMELRVKLCEYEMHCRHLTKENDLLKVKCLSVYTVVL